MRARTIMIMIAIIFAFTGTLHYVAAANYEDTATIKYIYGYTDWWLDGKVFYVFSFTETYSNTLTIYAVHEGATLATYTAEINDSVFTFIDDKSAINLQITYTNNGFTTVWVDTMLPADGVSYVFVLNDAAYVSLYITNWLHETNFSKEYGAGDNTLSITIVPIDYYHYTATIATTEFTIILSAQITHVTSKHANQLLFEFFDSQGNYTVYLLQFGNDQPGWVAMTSYEAITENGTTIYFYAAENLLSDFYPLSYTIIGNISSNTLFVTYNVCDTAGACTLAFVQTIVQNNAITSFIIAYVNNHFFATSIPGGWFGKDPDWLVDQIFFEFTVQNQSYTAIIQKDGGTLPYRAVVTVTLSTGDEIYSFLNNQNYFNVTYYKQLTSIIEGKGSFEDLFKENAIFILVFVLMTLLMSYAAYAYSKSVSYALATFFVFSVVMFIMTGMSFIAGLSVFGKLVIYVVAFLTLLFAIMFINFFRNRGGDG